ncbi:MAG: hypothetical protein AB1422_07505 [bacterium]
MKITNEKRKFLAENIVKVAEYIFSIVILGQIISGKVNMYLLVGSGIVFILLFGCALLIFPNKEGV